MPAQSSPAFVGVGRERQPHITTVGFTIPALPATTIDMLVLPLDGRAKRLLRAWVYNVNDPAATGTVNFTLQSDDATTETALTTLIDMKAFAALTITQLEVIVPEIGADCWVQVETTNVTGTPDAVYITLIMEWVYMECS